LIRDDVIAAMRRDARTVMPPLFLDALDQVERPFFTPIYDHASPRMVFGRTALIGDAASVGRPHMGIGVWRAAEAARAMADALAATPTEVNAGLARFEAERQPVGERVMRHGRKLGAHLGVSLETDEDRRWWALLQDPHAMLRHIAVPHFLNGDP